MSDNVLQIKNLSYAYPDKTQAIKDISLEIKRGEKVAVMGPNGSGKTTFFLCLNGVLKPQKGEILLGGKKVEYSKKGLIDLKKNVGIVFQDPDSQLFLANVYQEISFGAMNLHLPQEEVRRRVEKAIEEMDLAGIRDKPIHFLSYGQKKRVSIADVLVMEPQVIIFDEPTASLDPKHAEQIDHIIEELNRKGITVIVSTHDGERALAWADKIIVFDQGEIKGAGSPDRVFGDRALLQQASLTRPTLLEVYDELVEHQILPPRLAEPRTGDELRAYLRKYCSAAGVGV